MSGHTPGPWETAIHNFGKVQGALGVRPSPAAVTFIVDQVWGRDIETADANARLIAAAPDLLEALRKINVLATTPHSSGFDAYEAIKQIAAIAKAGAL